MLLEKNEKESSSKQARDVNARHHFVKDLINKRGMMTEHNQTNDAVKVCN